MQPTKLIITVALFANWAGQVAAGWGFVSLLEEQLLLACILLIIGGVAFVATGIVNERQVDKAMIPDLRMGKVASLALTVLGGWSYGARGGSRPFHVSTALVLIIAGILIMCETGRLVMRKVKEPKIGAL